MSHSTRSKGKALLYYIAPNRIGDQESEVLGIARGIDNPGSVLVCFGYYPIVFSQRRMVLVALKWGS